MISLKHLIVVATVFSSSLTAQIAIDPAAPLSQPLLGARDLVAVDIDRDRDPDIVVVNGISSTLSVLENDGFGAMTPRPPLPTGSSPRGITSGDFDGDGFIDVATADGGAGTVTVFANIAGAFLPSGAIPVGTLPRALVADDLDADGDLDLAVACETSAHVRILLNDGTGVFTVGAAIPTNLGARALAIHDMDFDGDPDLVVACNAAASVQIFTNDGLGGFLPLATIGTGPLPTGVAVGDFDGDLLPDIVASCFLAPQFAMIRQSPIGTYQATLSIVGVHPQSIAAADLDIDGDDDVLMTDIGIDSIVVLQNLGGNVQFLANVSSAVYPNRVVPTDLDGDFLPDLVVPGFTSNDVVWHRNVAQVGPVLGDEARGTIGAPIATDRLFIDGEVGGLRRRVDRAVGQPFTISIQPMSTSVEPAMICGFIGAPHRSDATTLPFGIGDMCFVPEPLGGGDPALFTLLNSFGPLPAGLMPPVPAPAFLPVSGVGFAFTLTLQGILFDGQTIGVTNGVILSIR